MGRAASREAEFGGLGLGGLGRTRLAFARESARCAGGRRGLGLGGGVEAGCDAGNFLVEQAGAEQTLGDAREDQGEVTGAEGTDQVGGVVRDGSLAERGGELLAVVDEFADEREQAAGAAWWG